MTFSGRSAGGGLARVCLPVQQPAPTRRSWKRRKEARPSQAVGLRARAPLAAADTLVDWVAPPRQTAPLAQWKESTERGMTRTCRAKARLQGVPAAARRRQKGLSFLERASLKRTLPRYEALWDDFASYAAKRRKKLNTVEQIDQMGANYLNDRYFAGDQPDVAGYLGATIRKFRPEVVRAGRGALARTLAAAKGFRNLCPAQTKQPLPWEATCLIVEQLCRSGQPLMGLAVVLAFALYLRANELLVCQVDQLTPPLRGGGRAHRCWCLVLHPSERGRRSKVGLADEAMRIEGDEFKFLTPLLRRWMRGRKGHEPMFEFGYTELSREFKLAGEKCGLAVLGPPTLHQLRHGGASTDAASGSKSLAEIQQKGRWTDPRSVRRYAKGGRVTQQLWQLTPSVRRKCLADAKHIGETLCSTLRTSASATARVR